MEAILISVALLTAGCAAALAAWSVYARCGAVLMRPFTHEVMRVHGELSAMLIAIPRQWLQVTLAGSMTIFVSTAVLIFSGWSTVVGLPVAMVGGLRAPRLIVHIVRARTRRKLADQMVDVLSLLSNALSAGMSLVQATELASQELANPMGRELKAVISKVKLGQSIEDAFGDWEKRWEIDDMSILAGSVAVLKKTGGNLVETFVALANTIRERKRVEGRIRVLTSQGLIQALTLIAMPLMLAAALYAVSPEYIEPLIATEPGKNMLAVGLVMQALGGWWIMKIVRIKV